MSEDEPRSEERPDSEEGLYSEEDSLNQPWYNGSYTMVAGAPAGKRLATNKSSSKKPNHPSNARSVRTEQAKAPKKEGYVTSGSESIPKAEPSSSSVTDGARDVTSDRSQTSDTEGTSSSAGPVGGAEGRRTGKGRTSDM